MKQIFIFILFPIFFTVIGEFLLKYSVDGLDIGFNLISIKLVLFSPNILIGLTLISLAAIFWIVGMSKFQLSFMYPFLSLNYIAIIIGSDLFLKEDVQINRYISILLILIGLFIISRSHHVKIKE